MTVTACGRSCSCTETRMLFAGSFMPVESSPLRKASCRVGPKHATSPVEAISTPSEGSAPLRRWKENMGTLTPTYGSPKVGVCTAGSCSVPIIARVAVWIKLTPVTLDEKGHDREARRLHSMTLIAPSLAISCMLKGPVICSASASLCVVASTSAISSAESVCGGSINVASPECTPAFSTCSEMALTSTLPFCATASTSISRPSSMNLETTTGCSLDTEAASLR
mmetsp:Transcript_57718/g.132522  ORF Transcript_57718/g.132522 Transcript_57718/m.132522 type:complete len:224 (-) Transcript_57718:3598-4269(-)